MRASQWFINTLKETPADAEIISHQLMLRAGLIRKLGSGLYTWLPLGLKVLRKVEQVVREEMNQAGALEVLMPAVQPAELWQETGRWESFGGQLLTMIDANERAYCFGPTHEEVITDLVRREIQSYKQLPINFYQIQTKFRDEIRPRFGVMRAREFIMKDAYSFHLTKDSLQKTYQTMFDCYCRIFTRLGLKFRAVEADTGAIGGYASHEFQVMADSGEDLIVYSDTSTYAANIEQATSLIPEKATEIPTETLTYIDTPNQKTIEDLTHFLNIDARNTLKTLIVAGTEEPFIALVLRGNDSLNEIKAAKHPRIKTPVQLIDDATIEKALKLPVGFIGPIDLPIPVIADHEALALSSFICGANKPNQHCQHASWNRDASYTEAYDLRSVQAGDKSPDGEGNLHTCRGIEVGHVFQLGDKYAKAMRATVLDEQGREEVMQMGCYGLGVTRVVAAAIEQHHDARGIIWPKAMAPFALVIIPINYHASESVKTAADALYAELSQEHIDLLLDDRKERPGALFADCDLMGIPHRLVVSEKHLQQGFIEYKAREHEEVQLIPLNQLSAFIQRIKG